MKIGFLNTFNIPKIQRQTGLSFSSATTFKGINADTFERQSDIQEKALAKINDFTKEEYESLTEDEKAALRMSLKKEFKINDLKNDVELHQYAAEAIKQVFDKQFGEGKYVAVPIGRSLSSIANLLAMKIGKENVKTIPMSNMGKFYVYQNTQECYDKQIENFKSLNGFESFKNYLKSIGLSKKEIENSKKSYVLLDYCASGMSLMAAHAILTSDEFLGNEKRNISIASMADITSTINEKTGLGDKIDSKLFHGDFKEYSTIPKINNDFTNIEQLADYKLQKNDPREQNKIKKIKLYNFALLDSEFSEKKAFELLKIKKQNTEKGKIWFTPLKQFSIDVEEDLLTIFKLKKRLKKNTKKLQTPELSSSLKMLAQLEKAMTAYNEEANGGINDKRQQYYYEIFRPNLLKELAKISGEFRV